MVATQLETDDLSCRQGGRALDVFGMVKIKEQVWKEASEKRQYTIIIHNGTSSKCIIIDDINLYHVI